MEVFCSSRELSPGHQTRRAVALQRAQSAAAAGNAASPATTPTQQVQKVTLQRAVSVDGGEVRTLVEGQAPAGTSLVQTPSGKTVGAPLFPCLHYCGFSVKQIKYQQKLM